jgi:hypothetical protein
MAKVDTSKRSSKREHRLKFSIGGHLSHFLDLRTPAEAGADFLFHVSNSHAKVGSKFVTDNIEHILTAHFGTNVEEGSERLVAREAVIDLGDGDLAYFGSERLSVFSSSFQRGRNKLDQILRAYRISEIPEKASFEIINLGIEGLYSSRTTHLRRTQAQSDLELRLHYGLDFFPWQESILRIMAEKCAGIHLLRGEPGTGKTSFIRHLVHVLRASHRFYFLPSYEYPRVGNGALIEFFHEEQDDHPNLQFVIAMEDAEAVLMPRKIDTGFSVSALLNLADGLLGEGLNLQFICTVNCEIEELDAAIVRPGRLRTARDFRLLTHSEAIELAEYRGLPVPHQRREYSLAEIYNPDEASVRDIKATHIGFFAENQ